MSVGTLDWVHRQGVREPQDPPALHGVEEAGATCIYVGVDGRLVGAIELRDALREGAAATVAMLQCMGITPVLLSGG